MNNDTLKKSAKVNDLTLNNYLCYVDDILVSYTDFDTLSDVPQEVYNFTRLRYEAEYVRSIRVLVEQLFIPTLSEATKNPEYKTSLDLSWSRDV